MRDELYLGQRRWQELTFKLEEKDARDERELGVWPLVLAADQREVFDQPGQLRLRLGIQPAGPLEALWRKYTSSYRQAYLATRHRWNYVFNSAYLVALSIAGQLLSCSLVAYAFARLRWPGREAIFGLLLATMMLPGQVTMIPVFLIFKQLGWYNTLKTLWVPSFFGSAFFIFMLRQFMRAIPNDLEDAARIDGCGPFGIYWRIILPLIKPALAAVAIFTFMGTWNDFMGPLIYLNDQRLYPLALGLFDFRSQHGGEFGMLMAASTLMTLPVIAVFFLAQKYFIQGVTLTGMKG
ncbi:MAG: carbohydrate ABC transporter permease [Candidatus Latescibacteria bacterium]|nr:carbohydrate ABC transporter permease [Candidatus Latescibacterota bacterium]